PGNPGNLVHCRKIGTELLDAAQIVEWNESRWIDGRSWDNRREGFGRAIRFADPWSLRVTPNVRKRSNRSLVWAKESSGQMTWVLQNVEQSQRGIRMRECVAQAQNCAGQ